MILNYQSNKNLFEKPFRTICPHCGDSTSLILTSPPDYETLRKYSPQNIGIAFMCSSCFEPIFLKFKVDKFDSLNVFISNEYDLIENPKIDFEFEYLPKEVLKDFKEALNCYSIRAFNAFASMSRRVIQSTCEHLGAKGKSKVQHQIQDLKEIAEIDEGTYEILQQIILNGHDGAHPHLPPLSSQRAEILLEFLKDVVYQLYVRKGKIKKASELRQKEIQEKK